MRSLRSNPWWVVVVLWLVMIMSHVDRNILVILMGPIQQELDLSDTWMGFLTGPAFALFYTIAGIPLAILADRASRKWIIAIGLALWSVCTVAQGWARNIWHFTLLRVLLGMGEATTGPSSHSIISDYFPPRTRASALSFFSMGGHMGMLLGLALGGYINEWVGWRSAFIIVGIPGVLLAGVVLTGIREPERGQSEQRSDEAPPPFRETLRHLLGKRSFVHIALTMSLFVMTVYGMNVWVPQMLQRVHGLSIVEAGTRFGLVTGISGLLGTMFSGWLADRLSSRDPRWGLWLSALGGTAMIPFTLYFLFADSASEGLAALFVGLFFTTFYMGPCFSLGQGLATLRMRAQASAILLFVINIVGSTLGPQAIGVLNDQLHASYGESAIRYSLLLLVATSVWASIHALLGTRTLRADLERTG